MQRMTMSKDGRKRFDLGVTFRVTWEEVEESIIKNMLDYNGTLPNSRTAILEAVRSHLRAYGDCATGFLDEDYHGKERVDEVRKQVSAIVHEIMPEIYWK